MTLLLRALAVAAAYAALGRLALLLAIPPGYATAVWPAAGVALVAVLVWGRGAALGVALGSFVVNDATGVAAAIAGGAALQALFAAHLVRRSVTWPTPLEEQRDILDLLLRGGPLGCAVSPTVGVATLYLAGAVPAGDLPFSWLTWWVGDVVGTILVAPPLLLALVRPRPRRRRLASVGVPLVVGFALVTALYVMISGWERQRQRDAFGHRAAPIVSAVEGQLRDQEDAVIAVTSLFAASVEVSGDEFRAFATPLLHRYPALQGLGWNPVIGDAARDAFERAVRTGGHPTFTITERGAGGALVVAARRPAYSPVYFLEPAAGNEAVLGFDLASEPVRREAMDRALATGAPAATAAITLVQDGQPGVLLLSPHVRDGVILGYGVGIIRVAPLIEAALAIAGARDVELQLRDASAPDAPVLHGDRAPFAPWWSATIEVGGRQWRLAVRPGPAAPELARSWVGWAVLAAGLVLVGLLGALTLTTTGRSAQLWRDASQQREAIRTQQLLLDLNETANRAVDVDKLVTTVVTRVGEHAGADRCVFQVSDVGEDQARVEAEWCRGVPPLLGTTYRLSGFSKPTQDDLHAGRAVINHDAATDPRTRDRFAVAYQPLGIVSYVVVPLFRDGVWKASVWVAFARPHTWTTDEVAMVRGVAERAWTWIEQVRMAGELRQLNQNLERNVAERTRHLDAAVREREVLLKEIHHRVKNNLQVISSLLGLQAHHVVDVEARRVLEDSRSRVLSMALVHENLYQTRNLAEVGFAAYLRLLADHLLSTYGAAPRGVSVRVSADGMELPVNLAIPCGLIVSELVINALKHAFPGDRGGRVDITLRADEGDRLCLQVADDGVGLPPGLDLRATSTFGMEIVLTFAEQLHAEVETSGPPGTTFTFRFPRAAS